MKEKLSMVITFFILLCFVFFGIIKLEDSCRKKLNYAERHKCKGRVRVMTNLGRIVFCGFVASFIALFVKGDKKGDKGQV